MGNGSPKSTVMGMKGSKSMKLFRNRKGQGLTEYLLMLTLIAIGAIGAVMYFSESVREQLANVSEELHGVVATQATEGSAVEATTQYNMSNYFDSHD